MLCLFVVHMLYASSVAHLEVFSDHVADAL
jgi:hypothetical protein